MTRHDVLCLALGSAALAAMPAFVGAAQPAAFGFAVPGTPPSTPGMEVCTRLDPCKVFLVDKRGHETVFASYPRA
jgi:hypothetical protein